MNTPADKTQENKSRSVANPVSRKQGGDESVFQFVDNRPEAITQRKLQEFANNSPQAKLAARLQDLADRKTLAVPSTMASATSAVQRKLWVEGVIYTKPKPLDEEFQDPKNAIYNEAVSEVLMPYTEGEPVFYNLTKAGLRNHVHKTLGSAHYNEPAEEPMLLFQEDWNWVKDLERRFEHEMWVKLDKQAQQGLMSRHKTDWKNLMEAVATIEGHWRRRGYYDKKRPIGDPLRWIEDYALGRNFEVMPTLVGEELAWEYSEKRAVAGLPPEGGGRPVSDKEIKDIFVELEKQVPHKDASDGCFARADYSAYLMQVVMKLANVGKLRIEVSSGETALKPEVGPFKEAAKDKAWLMHTAAQIKTSDGNTWVMDVALSKPLSPNDWRSALLSHTEEKIELKVTETLAWDKDLQNDSQVSMIDMLSQLRGLYLSERAGSNDKGGFDPWTSWQIAKGFEPIDMHEGVRTKVYFCASPNEVGKKGYMLTLRTLDKDEAPSGGAYRRVAVEEKNEIFYLPNTVDKVFKLMGIVGLKSNEADLNKAL